MLPELRIRNGRSGIKTFVFRKRVGGEMRNITIGRFSPSFGLAEARKKALPSDGPFIAPCFPANVPCGIKKSHSFCRVAPTRPQ